MSDETKSFEGWAIVELMGHVRLAGRVSPAPMFGTELIRVDVPEADSFTTQYASGASLYRLTPCSEEVARAVAGSNQVIPVSPWELRRLEGPRSLPDGDAIDRDAIAALRDDDAMDPRD